MAKFKIEAKEVTEKSKVGITGFSQPFMERLTKFAAMKHQTKAYIVEQSVNYVMDDDPEFRNEGNKPAHIPKTLKSSTGA